MNAKSIMVLTGIILIGVLSCQPKDDKEERTDKELRELGLDISNTAFAQLSGHLMNAIEQEGVIGAIGYCNINAYPIIDSVAHEHNVTIKRVSNLNRNPDNSPDEIESSLIAKFTAEDMSMTSGDTLLTLGDGSKLYARPILLQAPCLKCHGIVGTDIAADHYEVIKMAYPNDKAVGYSPGDFRGMWVIRF